MTPVAECKLSWKVASPAFASPPAATRHHVMTARSSPAPAAPPRYSTKTPPSPVAALASTSAQSAATRAREKWARNPGEAPASPASKVMKPFAPTHARSCVSP